jgi:hypothetical protein
MDPQVILMNKEIWNRYLISDTDILFLYMQLDSSLKDEDYILDISNNILKVPGAWSVTPGAIILTLRAMAAITQNFSFDFICRATTSTFWIIPKLKNNLKHFKKTELFMGSLMNTSFVSGCAMIFSNDIVYLMLSYMVDLIEEAVKYTIPDDVLFSDFIKDKGIPFTDMPLCNIDADFFQANSSNIDNIIKENDTDDLFCFRVKTTNEIETRLETDRIVLNKLYNYFYG